MFPASTPSRFNGLSFRDLSVRGPRYRASGFTGLGLVQLPRDSMQVDGLVIPQLMRRGSDTQLPARQGLKV